MSNPDNPAAAQQTTPFDSILAQSRDLACERLTDALAAMLDKVEERLTALVNETQNAETQKLYVETRDKTLAQRDAIEQQFRTRYVKEFQQRSNKVRKIGQSFSDFDMSSLELGLVGEDDLEETLKFSNMAAKLRRFCDDELNALDQRVGVLLGDADLQSEDNPFSPQAILDAYKHTCRQADAENIKVRMVLLKLFDDHVVDDIRSIYKDVNELLVKNSILPKIRYGVSRQEGGKSPAGGKDVPDADGAAAPADKAAPSEQDFFTMMQNLMKAGAGAGGLPGFPGIPGAPGGVGADGAPIVVLQGADLLNSLTRLQRGDGGGGGGGGGEGGLPVITAGDTGTTNVLRELKSSSVGAGMGQMDAMTLDIISMLFDQLFDEPKIPIGVKGLIGRMQIPMLKVAIADKAFFSKKTHPARQLLDTLGDIAVRLPADFNSTNPLFGRLETVIQEVMDGFQDNVEIFDTVRGKVQALIAEEDQRLAKETEVAAKRIEQQESLAVAKASAQDEIRARVRPGKTWRPAVAFLVQHWIKFLLLIHVKRGKDSEVWKTAVETMDHLLWTVEPKKTLDERNKLAAMVPGLVKRIGAGLKAAGVEDGVATRFFDELIKRHTEVIGPVNKAAEAAAAAAAAAAATPAKPESAAAAGAVAAPAGAAVGKEPVPAGSKDESGKAPPAGKQPAAAPAAKTGTAPAKAATGKPAAAAKPAEPASTELDFTASITVKNPFGGGGDVQVEEMDFTGGAAPAPAPAGGGRAKRGPSDADLTDKMADGTWVEFKEKNPDNEEVTRRPAKLSYVSPMKARYLFIDRSGKTVLECSRAELARRMRLGDVVVMDEAPLFDRIMGGLVSKMRGAPAPQAKGKAA